MTYLDRLIEQYTTRVKVTENICKASNYSKEYVHRPEDLKDFLYNLKTLKKIS